MHGELTDVSEGVLVGGRVVEAVDLGGRVLHKVDGGKGVDRGGLAGSEEGEVDSLEDHVLDSLVSGRDELPDGEEAGNSGSVGSGGPELEEGLFETKAKRNSTR